jgi:hypothetical protein
MKLASLAIAAAAAAFSISAVAGGDKHQQSKSPEAVKPAQGDQSAASGGSAPTTPSTEGNTPSGAVISPERTAEPKAPTAAGSSITEQKPEQVPPPATTKQQ